MKSPESPIRVDTSHMATKGAAVTDRTAPEALPQTGGRKEKKPLIQRLAGNLALRLVLAAAALTGAGYAVYQEVPAVHRNIDKILGKEAPSLFFDNTVIKGVASPNNTLTLPQESLSKLPGFDEKGNALFLFPIPVNKNLPFVKDLGFPFRGTPEYDAAVKAGLTDTSDTPGVPPNTPIRLIHDGYVFSSVVERPEGKVVIGYAVAFLNPNDGVLVYAGPAFTEPIRLTAPVPPGDYDLNKFGKEWQKGMLGKEGDLLGFTGEKESLMSLHASGGKDGSRYNGDVPVPLILSTQVDGNGLVKLVVPPSQ